MEATSGCTLCPRRCRANRTRQTGVCGAGSKVKVARAAAHHWEEPCLSGPEDGLGSGTVFFSGCPLGCCFCQNTAISHQGVGKEITVERLAEIFLTLGESAYNLNLVSPTQFVPQIIEALDLVRKRLTVPVVYNTGGYETVETLRMLEGYVDIYLPDLKFFDPQLSARYCAAPDYFETASRAILEMFRQTGPLQEQNGLLLRGLMVRHLVLPGARRDSARLLEWLAAELPVDAFYLSLMSQYTPCRPLPQKELNRRVSTFEYNEVLGLARTLGFQGFMQHRTSAREEYTPPFDLEGV